MDLRSNVLWPVVIRGTETESSWILLAEVAFRPIISAVPDDMTVSSDSEICRVAPVAGALPLLFI